MIIPSIEHLSYSSIYLFDLCPRCWYLKYIEKYQLPGSDAMELGSNVHTAIEMYHKNNGEMPPPSYLSTFVSAYAEEYKPEDFDFVEQKFEVPIVHPDDFFKPKEEQRFLEHNGIILPLQARIDRIWKGRIRDVKTSYCKYKQEQIDGARQTSLYAYVYRQQFGEKEAGISYDVLIKNKLPKLQPMDANTNDLDIIDALKWIWDGWEKILNSPIPEYHSPHCYNANFLP
jgi:hypothetical protein